MVTIKVWFQLFWVCIGMFQVSPAPVRSPADAEKKRSLQRALDGLTPQLQEVVMEEGRQHDIRDLDWIASFGGLAAYIFVVPMSYRLPVCLKRFFWFAEALAMLHST